MKKSNTLILLAILIVTGAMITYNFKLKAMYDSRSYKNRFFGMEFTPFSGVEKINLKAIELMNVQIEQSDKEGIWLNNRLKEGTSIAVVGNTLDLNLNSSVGLRGPSVIIMTKRLSDLDTECSPRKSTDLYKGNVEMRNYKIKQFNLKGMGRLSVDFKNVQVDTLNAVIGKTMADHVELELSNDSKAGASNYAIGKNGILILKGNRSIGHTDRNSTIVTKR